MIIFDLDGTLADCEHRRHFVDASYRDDCYEPFPETLTQKKGWYYKDILLMSHPPQAKRFCPDWKSFYEACDQDEPILSPIHILEYIGEGTEYGSDTPWVDYDNIEIWSGRCESVRKKTEKWIYNNIKYFNQSNLKLKMRPIGDSTPDDELKERWLDEAISDGKQVDMVFDASEKFGR